MSDSRKHPTAAFWATVVVVVALVVYPLSYGPICWAVNHFGLKWAKPVAVFYWPLEAFGSWLSNRIFGH
jgi:hypothetical protein